MRLKFSSAIISICFISCLIRSDIDFSSKSSQLTINNTGKLRTNTDLVGLGGSVVVEPGGQIIGGKLFFTGGSFGSEGEDSVSISGNFWVDATTQSIQNLQLGKNPITFQGQNTIALNSDLNLQNTWTFAGNANFKGNGLSVNLSDASASIVINSGVTVTISNSSLLEFSMSKISFADQTSVLNIVDSKVSLAANISQSTGSYLIGGLSTFVLNSKNVLLTSPANLTVASGATLWLDNRGSTTSPIFSMLIADTSSSTGYVQSSLINNTSIKIITDQSQVVDPNVSILTSGQIPPFSDPTNPDTGAGAPVQLTSSAVLNPQDQIVVSSNVEISGSGTSLTFTNTTSPQIVVQEGKTVSFGDIELLRITQNTFELQSGSSIRLQNNAILEFVEDVAYDKGQFVLMGENNTALLRGTGGRKKISLKKNSDGTSAKWLIGSNNLILEDIEIDGLENFQQTSQTVNGGTLYEGKMILTGQTKININFDSNMHFLIKGEANKLVFQKNNLTLNGKIRFADSYDSSLHIAFNLNGDTSDLAFNLGLDALMLGCNDGQCGLYFDNDKVTVVNKEPTSFIVRDKSFLSGGVVNIAANPIVQETPTFSLTTGTEIETSLPQPILFQFDPEADSRYEESGFSFRGDSTKGLVLPKLALVIKTRYNGKNLAKTVGIRSGGVLESFYASPTFPTGIIMGGNAVVDSLVRRTGKVTAQVVRDIFSGNVTTDTSLDTFKKTDKLFITGINNVFKVTGLLEFNGQIFLDEGAELIFKFDDSVDVVKAIKFSNSSFGSFLSLPKKSSIIFEGNGSVFLGDGSIWTFAGTPVSDQPQIGNGVLVDDRPSLIFRNFAQMVLDDKNLFTMKGNGKLIFQSGGQLKIEDGILQLGVDDADFFDVLVDKNSSINIGVDSLLSDTDPIQARLSMAFGLFNLRLDRLSKLNVKNKGIFEVGLLNSVYNIGSISQALILGDSEINVSEQGVFALGYPDLSLDESLVTKFSWDNSAGSLNGNGVISLYTNDSQTPKFSSRLQNKKFKSSSLSSFDLFKNIVKRTSVLVRGCDFIEASTGAYELITPANILVHLVATDTIRAEGPTTGNIYGTSAAGVRFGILPDGTKEFYS